MPCDALNFLFQNQVWALKDLGIQASQHIMLSREPLRLMRDLSHNLPSLVSTISRLKVNASMQSEIEQNHQFMHPGMNLVLLNGRNLDAMDTTPFGLLETLKQEVAAMESLMSVGMDVGSARKLLIGKQENRRMGMMEQDEPFRIDVNVGDKVLWLNDIEADARYSRWPRNLENLLQRGWPGQLRTVCLDLGSITFQITALGFRV
jgi:UDP-glucose:glycoprotein glucosyltransferase